MVTILVSTIGAALFVILAAVAGFMLHKMNKSRKLQHSTNLTTTPRQSSSSLSSGRDYDEINYDGGDYRGNEVALAVVTPRSRPINLRDPSDVEESYLYDENESQRSSGHKSNGGLEPTAPITRKEDAPSVSSIDTRKIIKVNSQGDVYTESGVYLQ